MNRETDGEGKFPVFELLKSAVLEQPADTPFRCELDSTVMDIMLVAPGGDSGAGRLVRPTVYMWIDAWSRAIVGFAIRLTPDESPKPDGLSLE